MRIINLIKKLVNNALSIFGFKIVNCNRFLPCGVSVAYDLTEFSGKSNIHTIFDVGANVGRFSLMMNDAFPNARIFAFEPAPETFEMLAENVGRCKNIYAQNVGVSDKNSSGKISIMECSEMNTIKVNQILENYFTKSDLQTKKEIKIKLISVDSFCADSDIEFIDLLKIDTEGHDLQVLDGAKVMLRKKAIKYILIEFYRPAKSNYSGSGFLDEIAIFLNEFDFEFVTIYTEWVDPRKDFFGVHNALFAQVK